MKLYRDEKTKNWEVEFANEDEAKTISEMLQAAAHEGVGKEVNGKKFSIIINGTSYNIESNRELWMLARGIQQAFTKPKPPKVSKKKEEATQFSAWDKAFNASEEVKNHEDAEAKD